MLKILVVIPTYNEIENVENVIQKVLSQSKDLEILVVDDSSPDGTGDLVENLSNKEKRLHLGN